MTTPANIACRVTGLTDLTADIRCLLVEPQDAALHHRPGQFAKVTFDGMPQRDYSLANAPAHHADEKPFYEFHIRRERAGQATRHVFEALSIGDPVALSGPYGDGYLREGHAGPVVAVGGGSGLAPMKAIVDAALQGDPDRPVHLYFGARNEADLYLLDYFEKKRATHQGFSFTPVLSEPTVATNRRTGFVHEAVLADRPEMTGAKIYMAGPPIMVENALGAFLSTGINENDLHYDLPPSKASLPID